MSSWLSEAEKAVAGAETLCIGCARALTLRLTTLLLHRLGEPLASQLVGLLPENERGLFSGALLELGAGEASIGYPDFIEHAAALIPDPKCSQLVDSFLAGVHSGLPESLEARVTSVLPLELRLPFTGVRRPRVIEAA